VYVCREVNFRLRHMEKRIGMSHYGLPGFFAVEYVIRRRCYLLRKSRIGT
jgi:hypothetical protein